MLIDLLQLLGLVLIIALVAGWFWCIWDAFEHTDMGWVWLILLTMFMPLSVPTYLVMRAYANRGPTPTRWAQMRSDDNLVPKFRFANEIERARFIEAMDKGQGTMYEPEPGMGLREEGYAHFTDQKAETLIGAGRHDEAWAYLIDVYDVAQKELDPLRQDTYRHYIARLPEGLERLRKMGALAEQDPDRPAERRPEERSLPF